MILADLEFNLFLAEPARSELFVGESSPNWYRSLAACGYCTIHILFETESRHDRQRITIHPLKNSESPEFELDIEFRYRRGISTAYAGEVFQSGELIAAAIDRYASEYGFAPPDF